MKLNILFLTFGFLFFSQLLTAENGFSKSNQTKDVKPKAVPSELKNEEFVLNESIKDLIRTAQELDNKFRILTNQLTPEQQKLCEDIYWVKDKKSELEKIVYDIGSAKLRLFSNLGMLFGTVVLILLAFMTVVSLGVYRILVNQIEKKVISSTVQEMHFETGVVNLDLAHTFYIHYLLSQNMDYLDRAIDVCERAYKNYINTLDESVHVNEELKGQFRNNWGYYLAERRTTDDKELARQYADYICQIGIRHPERLSHWVDSREFIEKQYSDSVKDLSPGFATACYSRACVYSIKGETEKCLIELRKAIEKNPFLKERANKDKAFDLIRDHAGFMKVIENAQ